MTWILKAFNDLTVHELYQVIRLRNEVFVVEQNCVFQDADNVDQQCHHLMGREGDLLAAYVRIVPPGLCFPEPSIGRVVSSPEARGKGAGRALMEEAIRQTCKLYGAQPIQIGAQLYLEKFYQSLGFEQAGPGYLEDGIEHIHMIKKIPPIQ